MTIYVAEIDGRAIAAFRADNNAEAETHIEAEWFRAEISVLETDGRPLWDGDSEVRFREAVEEERAAWEKARAKAALDGAENPDDLLIFLVPVSDPTDDDEGDD